MSVSVHFKCDGAGCERSEMAMLDVEDSEQRGGVPVPPRWVARRVVDSIPVDHSGTRGIKGAYGDRRFVFCESCASQAQTITPDPNIAKAYELSPAPAAELAS